MPAQDKTMDWLMIAGIIAQEGLAVAQAVYAKWSSGQMPTAADFDELRTLGKQTPEGLVMKAAALAGLDAADPKVVALLALVAPPLVIPVGIPKIEPPPPPAA